MSDIENKLAELKSLLKGGLISKEEYIALRERAFINYGKIPQSIQDINTPQYTQRTQATQRTQTAQRTQTTQKPQNKKRSGFAVVYFFIFIIGIVVNYLTDCGK